MINSVTFQVYKIMFIYFIDGLNRIVIRTWSRISLDRWTVLPVGNLCLMVRVPCSVFSRCKFIESGIASHRQLLFNVTCW